MASIPCTLQLRSSRPTRSPWMAAQGQDIGEAAAVLRTPVLGASSGDDVHNVSSPVPHSDAGKAKKKGNLQWQHSVEVVDLNMKRSNPLRSRLKFGFPKLSEMFA